MNILLLEPSWLKIKNTIVVNICNERIVGVTIYSPRWKSHWSQFCGIREVTESWSLARVRSYGKSINKLYNKNLNRDMTKPTKWVCAQRRLRSAWASAQSDQNLFTVRMKKPWSLAIKRTPNTLIRLGRCPGWSESSLGAQSLCWFCHVPAQILSLMQRQCLTWKIT